MDFSLIYPSSEHKQAHLDGKDCPYITSEVLDELGLSEVFNLQSGRLCDFFTMSKEVIEYRQEVFKDLIELPKVASALLKATPIISDIAELRRLTGDIDQSDSYLYSVTEVELYVSCMELLRDELLPLADKVKSKAIVSLIEKVKEVTDSEYFDDLTKRLSDLSSRVREIKSVTIGVNLDARLRPESAGVLSVNNEHFKSGALLQKILRLDFKSDEYTCIATLQPLAKNATENQQNALEYAFNNALNTVFKASMRSWKKVVQSYVLEHASFLINLLPEIELLVKGTELINTLKSTGNDVCFPQIKEMNEKSFLITSITNPVVAIKLGQKLVENDFAFDENGTFYVLSGPNRGGKSVISCAVGLNLTLAQLGLVVCAKEAVISPADAIFTHFPTGSEDTIDKGRLGEECARLDEIFEKVTENSLVLLDETLSSTGSYEGSYIASEVLSGFSMVRCRGIFSTHLHELSAMLDDINERCEKSGGAKIDTLVAGMEEGQRSFKIYRKKPDGRSYARDIANKYGISLDSILKKIEKNK